jgi:hypothetical protein
MIDHVGNARAGGSLIQGFDHSVSGRALRRALANR